MSLSSSHPVLFLTGREGEEAELSFRKWSALPSIDSSYSTCLYVFGLFFLIVQGNVKVHIQIMLHGGHRLSRFGLHNPQLTNLIAVDGSHIPGCHMGKVSL